MSCTSLRNSAIDANPQARSLSSGRTHSLALLIPGATNPYFFDLIRGTQTEAKVRGYRHMLVDTEASAELEEQHLQELAASVDGVVLTGSRLSDERIVYIAQGLPMVVVNREIEGVPSVVVDTSTAVTQALNYLASLGHSRVAFLGGPITSWSSQQALGGVGEGRGQIGNRVPQSRAFRRDAIRARRPPTLPCITKRRRACSSTTCWLLPASSVSPS